MPRSGLTLPVKEYGLNDAPTSADEAAPKRPRTSRPRDSFEDYTASDSVARFDWGLVLKVGGGAVAVLLIITLFYGLFRTTTVEANVSGFQWHRSIDIEELRTLVEEDWDVPADGRKISSRQEIHHYEDVIDHYETKTERVSEQVKVGTKTVSKPCGKVDKGNGFFETKYCDEKEPVYETRYRYVTTKEPVYRKEPRYRTKYRYEVDRWTHDRTDRAYGADRNPYWPPVTLGSKERERNRSESYSVHFMDGEGNSYSVTTNEAQWQTVDPEHRYKLKVNAFGMVLGFEQ